jgi:hypothetical protein
MGGDDELNETGAILSAHHIFPRPARVWIDTLVLYSTESVCKPLRGRFETTSEGYTRHLFFSFVL